MTGCMTRGMYENLWMSLRVGVKKFIELTMGVGKKIIGSTTGVMHPTIQYKKLPLP